ncbi:hypothetical protein AYO46_07475 [Betaproteobacteria bacterium SCGC AG-212-J23]|nr:hypothetical protein AYO46_07475 [Betaproteobacteria bacterium SCGC AG-212-J23]
MVRDEIAAIKRHSKKISRIREELQDLDYASYRATRNLGCGANSPSLNFAYGERAPILEARYQAEKAGE